MFFGVLVLVAVFWSYQRSFLVGVGQQALAQQPDTIEFFRVPGDRWDDPVTAEWLAKPLREKGFVDLGVYQVLPVAGFKLGVMINEKDSVAAFLCERPKALGISLELNVRYIDGTTTMLINRADNGVPKPPFFRVIFDPLGASSGALYERLLRERSNVGIKTITAQNVFAEYQAAWSMMMRWEKGRGLTAEEVSKIAASAREGSANPPSAAQALAAASTGDIPCPQCGQLNELQRDFCWACFKPMHAKDKPRAAAASAPPDRSPDAWSSAFPGETKKLRDAFRVERDGAALQVTWKWGSPAAAVLLFIVAIGWYGLNRFMFGLGGPVRDPSLIWSLMPTLWALVPAVGYAYWGLAIFINSRVIRMDPMRLTVRNGPIPLPRSRDVPTGEIDRIYSEMYVSHEGRGGGGVLYRVMVIRKGGKELQLLPGVSDPAKAEFIVQQLSAFLGAQRGGGLSAG